MTQPKRLLLVGWDSADWKLLHPLMDSGATPAAAHLVNTGSSGNLTTLEPQLSPMLWTSIATGKMAYHHGVPGFTEVHPASGRVIPVSAATRRCKTLWEILASQGKRCHVVGWFATHGEQLPHGHIVSNMFCHLPGVQPDQDPATWPPPPPGTYWPLELADDFNDLRISPFEVDPDQILRLFVPEGHTIDQSKDQRLLHLAQKLAEAFSTHSAAVRLMETRPEWDFMAVYYRALDEICHLFMHYHPPKMEGIPQADFDLYQLVVTGAYRLHDLFLQRLINLAGPDTAVVLVSDHGFHSDHLRPKFTPRVPAGITVWHRPQGVFAAAGPGFKTDELVFGARLLDITPTLLHWFGLPVGADMEGRVLTECLSEDRLVKVIPSWETGDLPTRNRPNTDPETDRALLDQFVALGYIDEVPEDPEQAQVETSRENDWNMARALMYAQRFEQALPLLEGCHHAQPARPDFAQVLAQCQIRLGLLEEAEATIDKALETFGRAEEAKLVKASIAIQREDFAKALSLLQQVEEKTAGEVQTQLMLARSYAALRQWPKAEQSANRVLQADPHNPQAHLELARIHLHAGRADQAAESALEAIGLQYGNPMGHFLLGAALVASQNWPQAETALTNSLKLAPGFLRAHRLLARVCRQTGDHQQARHHLDQSLRYRQTTRDEETRKVTALREASATRASIRHQADAARQEKADQAKREAESIEPVEVVVVSGLPRSGTSLMMQILKAGGMDILTDGQRAADEDNPQGYWEWEEIKKLPKNPQLIRQAAGRVVKVISALLCSLPAPHRYTILYMMRPVTQVVDSQWAMLARHNRLPRSERDHLIRVQEEHSRQIREVLKASDRVQYLEVSYPDLVANPQPILAQLQTLLGPRFTPGPAVLQTIQPGLFRNRT